MPTLRTTNNRRRSAAFKRDYAYHLVETGFEPRHANIGDSVKIGFYTGFCTEWMWAEVVSKDGDDYLVRMLNSGYYSGPSRGDYRRVGPLNILTTLDNCPLRAVNDLEPIGGSWEERFELLSKVEAETGLGRREAVNKILAEAA